MQDDDGKDRLIKKVLEFSPRPEVSCVVGEIGRFDTHEGRSHMTIEMTKGAMRP